LIQSLCSTSLQTGDFYAFTTAVFSWHTNPDHHSDSAIRALMQHPAQFSAIELAFRQG
jgi:hypothetical protein